MRTHCVSLAVVLLSVSALAYGDTIYSYTGHTFTYVTNGSGLTTSNFLSFTMTFANPIAPMTGVIGDLGSPTPTTGSSLVSVMPAQFSFTDGVHILDNNTPQLTTYIDVATDASGNIGAWEITFLRPEVRSGVSGNFMLWTENRLDNFPPPELQRYDVSCFQPQPNNCYDVASTLLNQDPAGTWMIATTSSAPEPSSLVLFSSGLAALVRWGQVKKRRSLNEGVRRIFGDLITSSRAVLTGQMIAAARRIAVFRSNIGIC